MGLVIAGCALALGIVITDYTLIVTYGLVLFCNLLLTGGHVYKEPKLYIVYIILNVSRVSMTSNSKFC